MGRYTNCFTLSVRETVTMCSICRLVSLRETTKSTDLINSVDWLSQPSSLRSGLRHYWRFALPNVSKIGSRWTG